MSAAIKGGRDRLIHERLRRRTQQLAADQQKDIALAHRQRRHIRLFQLQGGNQGMVIGYLLVVHQRRNIGEKLRAGVEGRHSCRQMQDNEGSLRHVAGQIPAVCPGIGQQLLFIERLGVVQGLLGRVAEYPVCLPLQGGQVVQLGRLFRLFLPHHGYAHGPLPVTGVPDGLGVLRGNNAVADRLDPLQRQPHMMVFLLAEQDDLAVPVGQHRQGGRLYPPHIQGAVVEDGEQAARIDTDEPVRLLAAKCRLIQRVIVRAGAQVGKALPDRRILHRRNPETGEGLGTSGSLIDQPEDQLTFASRVAGVDQLYHIGAFHQGTENVELGGLFLGHHITEGVGQDGKVLIPPLLIAVIVGGRVRQPHQMPDAPGNEPAAALKIAIGPGCDTQGRCDTLCYTRFFTDHQFAQFWSSCSPCSGTSSFSYSSSSNS